MSATRSGFVRSSPSNGIGLSTAGSYGMVNSQPAITFVPASTVRVLLSAKVDRAKTLTLSVRSKLPEAKNDLRSCGPLMKAYGLFHFNPVHSVGGLAKVSRLWRSAYSSLTGPLYR